LIVSELESRNHQPPVDFLSVRCGRLKSTSRRNWIEKDNRTIHCCLGMPGHAGAAGPKLEMSWKNPGDSGGQFKKILVLGA